MKRLSHATILCFLLALFGGTRVVQAQFTGTAPTSAPGLNVRQKLTTDPAILYPPNREMHILAGDLLRVSIYGVIPVYSDAERVSLDGSIRLNLAGIVPVEGLSLKEAEQAISARFEQEQTFHNAQVSIEVTEAPAHSVTTIGVVRGSVPVVGNTRLYDVLAKVGGLPPTASTVISITRPGNAAPIVVDVGNDPASSAAANIPIFEGDTITVGAVGYFYVVGAVTKAGVEPLNGSIPTTVVQAVTAAGGTTFAAKLDQTKVVRTVGDQRTVIDVPLAKIMHGQAEDITLQSNDIILVPSSAMKSVLRSGAFFSVVATAIALASILIR
jgi:polysaccharide export outer membrane protein